METKNHHHKDDGKEMKGGKKSDTEFYVQMGIIVILAFVIAFSLGKVFGVSTSNTGTGIGIVSASEIIPKGIPEAYGKAMGVSYDDVSPNDPRLADLTIQKLSAYEDKQLNSEQMARYIIIGSSISCEYCCGANAIIFSNGERACGCAHSYAMRGVAKYLLINNPEMTDSEILSELGKWKVLFFPGVHEQKAQVLEANGIDSTDYINLASNKYRGIEQGKTSGGAMVGGC